MTASPLDPEALRLEALARLDDARARRALDRATVQITPSALRWESSHGPVQGLEVALGLGAEALAELHAHPSSVDALEEALARSLTTHPGLCLAALRLVAGHQGPTWQAYRRSS